MDEKRSHARSPLSVPLSCRLPDGSVLAGTSRDISLGGMFIAADQRPGFNTKVTISIHLPGVAGESELPAIVRWTGEDGFGVQFGLLGARTTHAITELLRRRQRP